MVNKLTKYLHFNVYYRFCLRINGMRVNFKTNTIQNTVIKDIMLIRETVGLQYSTFVVVIKVI